MPAQTGHRNIRNGDTVLIRCKVLPTTEGSTRELYPGVRIVEGAPLISVERVDVVSVEHAFRVGDSVTFDHDRGSGEIVTLTPPGIEPPQAWIKPTAESMLVTRPLKALHRVTR